MAPPETGIDGNDWRKGCTETYSLLADVERGGYHAATYDPEERMPCLGVFFALFAPRFLIILLWLFTAWFKGIFDTALWPVLGFIFLPTTLLWYTAVHNWWNGAWGALQIIGLIIALVIDTSPAAGRRRRAEE